MLCPGITQRKIVMAQLIQELSQEVLSYHLLGNRWVWGSVGCSLIIYCQFVAMNASALSLLAFTVERYIAICHPMKAQVCYYFSLLSGYNDTLNLTIKYVCTMGRARRIISCCWLFCLCYSSPWLFWTQIKSFCVKGIGLVRLVLWPIFLYVIFHTGSLLRF